MIAQVGIFNASKRNVTDSALTMPSMATTILGWFRPMVIGRVTKTVVNFEVKEVFREQRCMGVIQPYGSQELRLKPEGQRSWDWQRLHSSRDINLETDERVQIKGVPYRVMSHQDCSEYGYVTYELVQDYTKAVPRV